MTISVILNHLLQLGYIAGLSIIATGYGLYCLYTASLSFVTLTEHLVFSIAIGFGALGYAVFFLAATQTLHATGLIIIMTVFIGMAGYGWTTLAKSHGGSSRPKNHRNSSRLDQMAGVVLLSAVIAGLLFVFTPATGNDALSYHLTVPREYLSHHGFFYIPGNLFSNYPLLGEMLYLIGLSLSGESVAKGIHFLTTLLVLVSMHQFSKFYLSNESPRYIPALIFFTIPSVFIIAHQAYTDLILTFYVFLAVWAYANWYHRSESESGWLILSGILSGLAAGTKYAGLYLPFLGCFGICLAARYRRNDVQQVSRNLLCYIAAFLVTGCPFYIKNAILTGNPIYPFFYGIFGGKGWDATLGRYYDLFLQNLGMGRSLIDYLLLPWNLSFRAKLNSPQFDGIIGPLFFLMLPLLFFIRKIPWGIKCALAFSGLMFLFWTSSVQQIRYLIPILPFLSIASVYVLARFKKKRIPYAVLLIAATACIGLNGTHIVKHFRKTRPDRIVLGREDRDAYLSRNIASYDVIRFINNHLPGDSKIFLIYMKNPGFLLTRYYYSDSMFESYAIQKILSRSTTPEAIYRTLTAGGFTHILYDTRYVFGQLSTFTRKEKERFADFHNRFLKLTKTSKNVYYLYALNR